MLRNTVSSSCNTALINKNEQLSRGWKWGTNSDFEDDVSDTKCSAGQTASHHKGISIYGEAYLLCVQIRRSKMMDHFDEK